MSFTLGLTGSIGMGKSTALSMFADLGIPVWDADAAVHQLYAENSDLIDAIGNLIPNAKTDQGLDRAAMRSAMREDPSLLKQVEAVVHPAVAQHRSDFIAGASDAEIVVLDIPLLFELNLQKGFDAVAVVSTDFETQMQRVLVRGTMTEADFETILAKQVPDAEKRAKADFIIPSDTMENMRAAIGSLLAEIRTKSDT